MGIKREYLASQDIIEVDGRIIVANPYGNSIYQYDAKDYKLLCSANVEHEQNNQQLLFMKSEIMGNKVYFAPYFAEKICVYDYLNNSTDSISIELFETKENNKQESKYMNIFKYKEYIYFLGYNQPSIIKLNTITGELKYIRDWLKKINVDVDIWGYFSKGVNIVGEKALIPLGCAGKLIELDLLTDTTKVINASFSDELSGIGGISTDNNGIIWVTARNSKEHIIIAWNKINNTHKKYNLPTPISNTCMYYEPIIYGNDILIMPETMDHAYIYSKNEDAFFINGDIDEVISPYKGSKLFGSCVTSLRRNGNSLYFFSTTDYKWNKVELETGEREKFSLKNNQKGKDDYLSVITNLIDEKNVLQENDVELDDFVRCVKHGDY